MTLTRKEQSLLKDLQNDEKLCVEKYRSAAESANDPVLQSLFVQIGTEEQRHYDTVTQMLAGDVPAPRAASKKQARPADPQALKSTVSRAQQKQDQYLLNDLLATEKYVSRGYDMSIFEFNDENARHCLNAIQGEEQHHGKQLADYMQANGMYC